MYKHKTLILIGNHPRHLYYCSRLIPKLDDARIVLMERESTMPSFEMVPERYKRLLKTHFENRLEVESEAYKSVVNVEIDALLNPYSVIRIPRERLNAASTKDLARNYSPDLVLIFGTDLLDEEFISIMPRHTINCHLGLSPWYKGSATLFWPFYFLEPEMCGFTLHKITTQPDAGAIYHQFSTPLAFGDGIHDVAARTVKIAAEHAGLLVGHLRAHPNCAPIPQRTSGRVWRTKDWRPEHLHFIYDVMNNRVVDHVLSYRRIKDVEGLASVLKESVNEIC